MCHEAKIAVSILGPPGSGKDTQAALAAKEYGLYHFKTSAVLLEMFARNPGDPVYKREYEIFKSGRLCTPSFVFDVVSEKTREIAKSGKGVVYSGSPRTKEEVERLTPILEELYGAHNIIPVHLAVSDEEAIWRNTRRKMCKQCLTPVIYSEETKDLAECPVCGGELVTRELDTPEMIRERLKVFRRDTGPVIAYYKHRGMLREVNGKRTVVEVFAEIKDIIDGALAR